MVGSNFVRQIKRSEGKWTDKEASKHKHDFSVHAYACVRRADGNRTFYNVMKCKHCNSFKCIPKTGSMMGFMPNGPIEQLPIIRLRTPHKNLISLKDAILDE